MGSSRFSMSSLSSLSSKSQEYQQKLAYFPNFDERPVGDQDFIIIEPRNLGEILNGGFSDLFEDEVVNHVWIYHCPLKNTEGANISAAALASVAGVATCLTFVPVINCVALPVAVVSGISATGLVYGTKKFLNHQSVMIKTKKWLYVLAKHEDGCECFRAKEDLKDHLLKTQYQYEEAKRLLQSDPKPQVLKEDRGTKTVFEMIEWMESKKLIEKNYNLVTENCQTFAKSLFEFLTKSENAIAPHTKSNEAITPPTMSNEAITPPTKSEEAITPPTMSNEAITPPTNSNEAITPPTKSEEAITPPTMSNEAIAPPPKSEEVITPPTKSEEAITPPTKSGENSLPGIPKIFSLKMIKK